MKCLYRDIPVIKFCYDTEMRERKKENKVSRDHVYFLREHYISSGLLREYQREYYYKTKCELYS